MTIPGGFIAGDVLGAADMNLLPAGKVGYAQVTSAQNGITADTDATSLTVTWTAVSARLYRISFFTAVDLNWSSGVLQPYVKITDGSNTQKLLVVVPKLASSMNDVAVTGSVTETGLSGSVTRKLRVGQRVDSGSGTIDVAASSTNPAYILVEDIGPA